MGIGLRKSLRGIVVLLAVGFSCCSTTQSPNQQVDDAKITVQLKTKLASDVRPSTLTNVDLKTTNGVVTLAGEVESDDVKRHARSIAEGIPGVTRVNNELQVQAR